MPKKLPFPTEKKTVRFYEGEPSILDELYPKVGYNAVIRELVHAHIKKVNLELQKLPQAERARRSTELDLTGLEEVIGAQ